ncbi:MAG: tetratricopeptide repeat protein [Chitinophagales bacterium]
MQIIIKKYILAAIVLISLQFTACQQNNNVTTAMTGTAIQEEKNKETSKLEIPELLTRKGAIAELSEWDYVQKTVKELNEKIKRNPTDHKSSIYLALIYMQEARITGEHPYYYPAALKILDHVIAQKPEKKQLHFQALVSQASVYLSQHEFEKALEVSKEALVIEDYDAQVYGALCDANVELGNYEEAVKMADKMVSIRPDLRSYSRVSYLRELHGDYKGAIEAMKLAVSAGLPGDEATAWSRITLGDLYRNYGDVKNAEIEYKRTLQERPNYAFATAGLAKLEISKGNYTTAKKLLNEAAEVMPEFSFYETLATVNQLEGNTNEVNKLNSDLIEMLQEDQESGHNMDLELANIYLTLDNNPEKALTYAERAYKERPDNITVNQSMAKIYYKKGDFEAAAKHIDKALQTNFKDPELLCLAGLVKHKIGAKTDGISLMQQSMALNPQMNNEWTKEAKAIL